MFGVSGSAGTCIQFVDAKMKGRLFKIGAYSGPFSALRVDADGSVYMYNDFVRNVNIVV